MLTWTTKNGYKITEVLDQRCHVLLVSNGITTILVDTNRKKYRPHLIIQLKRLNVAKIDLLVLTHTHFDHAENAAFIKSTHGAKVVVHTSEVDYLQNGDSPLPGGSILPTRLLIKIFGKLAQHILKYEPCTADILAEDGYNFPEYDINAYLLHTPGHCKGMMSLIIDDEIALVGDAMIGAYPNSIFSPFADDVPLMVQSWGKLLKTNCRLFLPAHGSANDRKLVKMCYTRSRFGKTNAPELK